MARPQSRPVTLSEADRAWLTTRVRTGSFPAQQVRRARILLELDEHDPERLSRGEPAPTQAKVAELAGVCTDTVVTVAKAYAQRGGDVADTFDQETAPDPTGGTEGHRRCRGPSARPGV